jgi:hypothetical protein
MNFRPLVEPSPLGHTCCAMSLPPAPGPTLASTGRFLVISDDGSVVEGIESLIDFDQTASRPRRPSPRTCSECGAILSRYNPSDRYCALHQPRNYRVPDRW